MHIVFCSILSPLNTVRTVTKSKARETFNLSREPDRVLICLLFVVLKLLSFGDFESLSMIQLITPNLCIIARDVHGS